MRVDSQLAITVNEGATASAVAGLGIAVSSQNSARADLEAGQLMRVLPDRDGSEWALHQRKDHKACRTGIYEVLSQGAPSCLGRLRPGSIAATTGHSPQSLIQYLYLTLAES